MWYDSIWIYTHSDNFLSDSTVYKFRHGCKYCGSHSPIQRITITKEFLENWKGPVEKAIYEVFYSAEIEKHYLSCEKTIKEKIGDICG